MTLDFWKILLSKQFSNNVPSFYFKNIHTNSSFTPYQNNGGTIISINTGNFSILASDTRITSGFSIPSRDTIRILKISENILLSTSGMRADMLILQENYKKAIKLWETENKKYIPISNGAYFLSSILYSRRFFPYYTFNIITGKNFNGTTKSFSFDAIGSFESCSATSSGTGQHFVQPILDGQLYSFDQEGGSIENKVLTKLILIKFLFLKASRRNIEIGDGIQIFVFTKKGVLVENSILRCD